MRGKDRDECVDFLDIGITPAYAGKSYDNVYYTINNKDHPRLCGEKLLIAISIWLH